MANNAIHQEEPWYFPEVVQFDSFAYSVVRVSAKKFNGSEEFKRKFNIVESDTAFFFMKNECYYDINLGDYVLENCQTGEFYMMNAQKFKLCKTVSIYNDGTILISSLSL